MALYFSTLFQFCFKNVTGSGFPTLMEGQTKREKRERERTELKMLFEWTRCCVRSWRAVSGTQTAVYDQKQSWREREQQRDGGFAGQCVWLAGCSVRGECLTEWRSWNASVDVQLRQGSVYGHMTRYMMLYMHLRLTQHQTSRPFQCARQHTEALGAVRQHVFFFTKPIRSFPKKRHRMASKLTGVTRRPWKWCKPAISSG